MTKHIYRDANYIGALIGTWRRGIVALSIFGNLWSQSFQCSNFPSLAYLSSKFQCSVLFGNYDHILSIKTYNYHLNIFRSIVKKLLQTVQWAFLSPKFCEMSRNYSEYGFPKFWMLQKVAVKVIQISKFGQNTCASDAAVSCFWPVWYLLGALFHPTSSRWYLTTLHAWTVCKRESWLFAEKVPETHALSKIHAPRSCYAVVLVTRQLSACAVLVRKSNSFEDTECFILSKYDSLMTFGSKKFEGDHRKWKVSLARLTNHQTTFEPAGWF